jgi:hypothetical protein
MQLKIKLDADEHVQFVYFNNVNAYHIINETQIEINEIIIDFDTMEILSVEEI